jgi:hypothetical protein
MEFWTLRGQQHRHDVRGPAYGFRLVSGAILEHEHLQRIRQGGRTVVSPPLERPAVAGGQCEKAARASGRFDGAIQREMVKLVGHGGDRLDAAGGHPTTDDGQEAQAGVVLGKDFDHTNGRAVFERLREARRPGGLKLGHRVGAFLAWAGCGRLGLARSLYRTSACTLA